MIRPESVKVGDLLWTSVPDNEAKNYDAPDVPPRAIPVLELPEKPLDYYVLGKPTTKTEFRVWAYASQLFPDEKSASDAYMETLGDTLDAAEQAVREYAAYRQEKGFA